MFKLHNPQTIAAPVAAYTHGVEIATNARLLFVSGQIPRRKDGTIPGTIEEQTDVVWENIAAVLASAGMGMSDICKINTYLTKAQDLPAVRVVRARHLGEHRPASTSVIVSALAWPEFLLEVEVAAAKLAPARRVAAPGAKARARKVKKKVRR